MEPATAVPPGMAQMCWEKVGGPRIHSLLADEDRETDKPAMNDHVTFEGT